MDEWMKEWTNESTISLMNQPTKHINLDTHHTLTVYVLGSTLVYYTTLVSAFVSGIGLTRARASPQVL